MIAITITSVSFFPPARIELAPKCLVGRKYSFLGYIVSFEIGGHPFRPKIKNVGWNLENCGKLFDKLIVRWIALSGLNVVEIRKRDGNAIVLFELQRDGFLRELESFAAGGDVLSETGHLLRSILFSRMDDMTNQRIIHITSALSDHPRMMVCRDFFSNVFGLKI
jgi:hypothetical protein